MYYTRSAKHIVLKYVTQKRQMLAEKAAQNAADVEKAYGGTVPEEGTSSYLSPLDYRQRCV